MCISYFKIFGIFGHLFCAGQFTFHKSSISLHWSWLQTIWKIDHSWNKNYVILLVPLQSFLTVVTWYQIRPIMCGYVVLSYERKKSFLKIFLDAYFGIYISECIKWLSCFAATAKSLLYQEFCKKFFLLLGPKLNFNIASSINNIKVLTQKLRKFCQHIRFFVNYTIWVFLYEIWF